MVGGATRYKKIFFLKKKNDQIEVIIDWLKELKNKYKIRVQWIRMGNAEENKMLARHCDQNEMGIKFEYTAPGTPQQKLTSKLKEAGFEPSIPDPCLFQHNNNRGFSILIMYIDDLLIIGKPETNENTINH